MLCGHEFYGTLCYPDDVTLVAPTVSALQRCEEFGQDFDVKYNLNKSVCIQIGGDLTTP